MKVVRFGIIGVGNMGSSYLYNIFEKGLVPDAKLTAVCDINPDKLRAVKEKTILSDLAYFDNYVDMLDSGIVDAIMVETPHYIHPEITIAALSRNIHVLCDKPAGVYAKQVRQMNEAAERSNALFGMMFNQRTTDVYRKMREMIADGAIGELQRITWIITNWFRTQNYYDSGNWRATWSGEGGGVLINQCPHQIDLVSWVVGKQPSAVRGFCQYGKWHDVEVEDEVTAYFEYDNGATGVFITTTGEAPGTNRLEISGTGGKILIEDEKLVYYKNEVGSGIFSATSKNGFAKPPCQIIEVECDGNCPQHLGIITNFTNAVLGREELFARGESGILSVELMNAIELSGWRGGERITMPPNEDEYERELNIRRASSRHKSVVEAAARDTEGSY